MTFSIELLTLFFFAAMIAGCIDAIAGGGGLITIPALLMWRTTRSGDRF